MATVKVRVEGLRELEAALKELPKATGKSVLRRVLLKRAAPIRDAAQSRAPRGETGHLQESAGAGTKLSPRQARLHRAETGGGAKMTGAGWRSDPKSTVEVFVGFRSSAASIVQEFGSVDQPAQPFMRPAWDAGKGAALDGIAADLWAEIKKTAERRAKRLAKAAAKG